MTRIIITRCKLFHRCEIMNVGLKNLLRLLAICMWILRVKRVASRRTSDRGRILELVQRNESNSWRNLPLCSPLEINRLHLSIAPTISASSIAQRPPMFQPTAPEGNGKLPPSGGVRNAVTAANLSTTANKPNPSPWNQSSIPPRTPSQLPYELMTPNTLPLPYTPSLNQPPYNSGYPRKLNGSDRQLNEHSLHQPWEWTRGSVTNAPYFTSSADSGLGYLPLHFDKDSGIEFDPAAIPPSFGRLSFGVCPLGSQLSGAAFARRTSTRSSILSANGSGSVPFVFRLTNCQKSSSMIPSRHPEMKNSTVRIYKDQKNKESEAIKKYSVPVFQAL